MTVVRIDAYVGRNDKTEQTDRLTPINGAAEKNNSRGVLIIIIVIDIGAYNMKRTYLGVEMDKKKSVSKKFDGVLLY